MNYYPCYGAYDLFFYRRSYFVTSIFYLPFPTFCRSTPIILSSSLKLLAFLFTTLFTSLDFYGTVVFFLFPFLVIQSISTKELYSYILFPTCSCFFSSQFFCIFDRTSYSMEENFAFFIFFFFKVYVRRMTEIISTQIFDYFAISFPSLSLSFSLISSFFLFFFSFNTEKRFIITQ